MSIQRQFNSIALKIQDSLAGLGDRDRKLLIGLAGTAFVGIIVGTAVLMNSILTDMQAKVDYRADALQRATVMAAEFQSNEETAQQISAKLEEHKSSNLSAFLEKTAQTVGIADRLDSVKASSTSINGELEETLYAAQFSKLTLEDVTNFLYEIETSGYPLIVQSTRLKTRRSKGERLLKMSLDIAAYKPVTVDGGEG